MCAQQGRRHFDARSVLIVREARERADLPARLRVVAATVRKREAATAKAGNAADAPPPPRGHAFSTFPLLAQCARFLYVTSKAWRFCAICHMSCG